MNKQWLGLGAAGAVALLAWAGSGVYVGMQAELAIKDLAAQPAATTAWRVSNVQHQRGLLRSSGTVMVLYSPGCVAQPEADDAVSMEVAYRIDHLPLPSGAARFTWQLTPQGEAAEAFQTLFKSASALSGEGSVGLGGALRSEMALPQVAVSRSGEVLDIVPSRGSLEIRGQALVMNWDIERAVVRTKGQALDIQGIALSLDIDNRSKGTGSGSFKVASASASAGSLEGLELAIEAREKGDRLNSSITPSVRKIEGGGQVLTDLRMQWALDGLHTASVETLIKLFEDSCGMQALTAQEGKSAAAALETLLTKGFSFGMPTLTAKTADGALDGSFLVELVEARAPSMTEQLRANGRLDLSGSAITPAQREMAVATGFALVQGDRLSASFDYAKGLFKVNKRTLDASGFEAALSNADAQVRTALAGLRNAAQAPLASADAEDSEAQAEAKAQSEAEAKAEALAEAEEALKANSPPEAAAPLSQAAAAEAPSATGACAGLAGCVSSTLQAARQGDVEAVRRLATRIEALPKPDLGNKAVARKLNAGALDALKQGDVALAVAQLRQARSENPQDVEIVANLGFALVKADDATAAQAVLQEALVLNPRRAATWTPLAEAMALSGRMDDAKAALWVAFQWSGNREKSLAFYLDRSVAETRPALAQLYAHMANVADAALAQDRTLSSR